MRSFDKNQIENVLSKHGIYEYSWISAEDIVVSQWVRIKCTFGCSDYGLGACPPNTPDVSECKQFVNEYSNILLLKFSKEVQKDLYPHVWIKEMTDTLLQLERDVFLLNYPKTFLLNISCCYFCQDCKGTRQDCKMKKQSRPSPEAFAIDVYSTVANAGGKLDVISEESGRMDRVGILFIQ